VAIRLENGYSRIEKLSWDSFNEAGTLIETVERYKDRKGCYPEAILADRIYRNRESISSEFFLPEFCTGYLDKKRM